MLLGLEHPSEVNINFVKPKVLLEILSFRNELKENTKNQMFKSYFFFHCTIGHFYIYKE